MNKRIKKKRELTAMRNQIIYLFMEIQELKEAAYRQSEIIEELNKIAQRNAQATNKRFDTLETYHKVLEDDVNKLKKNKKGFFNRN